MNNSNNRKKSMLPAILITILCCALIAGVVIFVVIKSVKDTDDKETNNSVISGLDLDPNAQDFTGQQSYPEGNKANPNATQTQIPGFDSIKLDFETEQLKVALQNPAGNPCYFVISLVVDGEVYYKSKMIPPGQAVYNAKIEKSVEKGEHEAVLQYECFHVETLAPLNGANTNVKLVVE